MGDEALHQVRERRAEKIEERFRNDYRKIMIMPEGRRIFYDLIDKGRMYRTTFIAGDPYATHINEGRRQMAIELTRRLERAKPGIVSQMINEHVSEERQHKDEDIAAKLKEEE